MSVPTYPLYIFYPFGGSHFFSVTPPTGIQGRLTALIGSATVGMVSWLAEGLNETSGNSFVKLEFSFCHTGRRASMLFSIYGVSCPPASLARVATGLSRQTVVILQSR